MNPRQKQDELGRFTVVGKERLSKRVRGIRLSVTIDEAIEALPEAERAEWLRRVVTQAAVRELLVKKQSATVSSLRQLDPSVTPWDLPQPIGQTDSPKVSAHTLKDSRSV